MTIQPISVNLFQTLLPARKLSNSKGLKKKRFLLNGFPESEKDRYFIAFKGKLMAEKPKAPCIRGRFVLLQVQEGEKIYYLWSNRNSLIKRLELDKKSLPKTYDYTSIVQNKIPIKQIKQEPKKEEKPLETRETPIQKEFPVHREERRKDPSDLSDEEIDEEISVTFPNDPELTKTAQDYERNEQILADLMEKEHLIHEAVNLPEQVAKETRALTHTAWRIGENPTEESLKRVKIAYEIGIYIFSLEKKRKPPLDKPFHDFIEGINPFYPKFWDENVDPYKKNNNPEFYKPHHLVRGLALEGSGYGILHLHTPFGLWTLYQLRNPHLFEELKNTLGLELDENPEHAPFKALIHRITKWKGEHLDELEYTTVTEANLYHDFQKIKRQVHPFPGINLEDDFKLRENNNKTLANIIDEQRLKNEAAKPPPPPKDAEALAKEERAKVHTAWLRGEKPTEESKERAKMAYEIGIYIFSLNGKPLNPNTPYGSFKRGINVAWSQTYNNPNPYDAQHLVKGLALEGSAHGLIKLHTPFGDWTLFNLDRPELFEKLRIELGLEPVQDPKFTNPLYAIRKWRGKNLDQLEYASFDPEEVVPYEPWLKIKKEIGSFPGIDGHPNIETMQTLVDLIDQQRKRNKS